MEAIKRAWRGEEKLWKVFWLYGVVGGIILNIVTEMALGKGLAAFAVSLPYLIWNLVSCWRCAWNAAAKFWGIIVRILVVLSLIGYVFAAIALGGIAAFFGGGAISGMAECGTQIESAAKQAGMTPEEFTKANPKMAEDCFRGVMGDKFPSDAPASAPAPVAPEATAPAPAATPDACEQQMIAAANQYQVEQQGYIAQNQVWLAQCRQSMAAQPQTTP